jgi:hypothetical protein
MKTILNELDSNLLINNETNFRLDLGWQEGVAEFEKEVLKSIINPIENFETVRYIHKPYEGTSGVTQTDIWFQFFFYNNQNPQTHVGGLDYEYIGITSDENNKMSRQATESFFRLELYKTPNNDAPSRGNRRLVYSKTLPCPLGEKIYYQKLYDYIHVPVFTGSNHRNKENMYMYWFQDDSVLSGTTITGDTFYVTARFFNAKDGSIVNFSNKTLSSTTNLIESTDMYYKLVIDKSDYSYQFYRYNGTTGTRIGKTGDPINFYEAVGGTS